LISPSARGEDQAIHAILELPHSWMLLVSSGGLLRSNNDKTLNALVAVAKQHEIKLILHQPNHGGGMLAGLLVSALQQNPDELGVEDAERPFVVKEQWIVDILEAVIHQHGVPVCPPAVEQDLDSAKHIDGKRRPLDGLFHQMTCMVRAQVAAAQDDRLDPVNRAAAHLVKHMPRDAHMTAMDHKARQLDNKLEKFIPHATPHTHCAPAQVRPRHNEAVKREN